MPKLIWWFGIGLVTGIGYNIKPTVLIAFVAIGIVHVLSTDSGRLRRGLWLRATCILLGGVVIFATNSGIAVGEDASGKLGFSLSENRLAVPATHFLMMGAKGTGGFNSQDILDTLAISDPQARFQHGLDTYVARVEKRGPLGYVEFLNIKGLYIYNDGTFYNWGEGMAVSPIDYSAQDRLSQELRRYLDFRGDHFHLVQNMWQSWWLPLLLLAGLPFLTVRNGLSRNNQISVLRLAIFGLTIFLLLFEARSRYLYLYLPFFIVLATSAVTTISTVRKPMESVYKSK